MRKDILTFRVKIVKDAFLSVFDWGEGWGVGDRIRV